MRDFPYHIALMAVVAIVFVVIAIVIGKYESDKWDAFAKAHQCKVIAKSAGHNAWGVGSDGKYSSYYVAGTTTYRCNDGIDYTR
jgi:hypothetical protein